MSKEQNSENKKERHKRVPVYTKKHYGNPEPTKNRKVFDPLPVIVLLVCVAGFFYHITKPKQAWEIEKETNEWYISGAYQLCEEHLKEKLRDPKSYEKAGETRVIKDNGMEKGIAWEFRARNGFGGMSAQEAVCLIKKDKRWVSATIK